MGRQTGIGILGCGYWGINYVRVFNELPESRVVAVCDQRADRLGEIGRLFPGTVLTPSLDEMLDHPELDAVVVSTPATTHYDVTRRCLAAGKHVLVEKPLTTLPEDANDLIRLADSKALTLMVGHTFVYNSGVRRLRSYIERGEVGRVYYLYARRTNLGPIRRDVSALWDLASHDVSIFNYLLDSVPEWVSAVGAKVLHSSREDVGFVSLGYPEGIVGHIHVSWADPNKAREVVVVGSEMRIVFDDLNGLEKVRVFEKGVKPISTQPLNFGEYQLEVRDGDIRSPKIEVSEPLKNQCRHFVECVASGAAPLTNGWRGQEVVRVLQAIDSSIIRNGSQVKVLQAHDYEHSEKRAASAVG